MDFLVVVSPGESWQARWLVMAAPNASEAEQAVWTERGYNSGEPVRVHPVSDRSAATDSALHVITYDKMTVDEHREMVRYND
jgi:hypothetical protein